MGVNLIIPGADFSVNSIPVRVLLKDVIVINQKNVVSPLANNPDKSTVLMYKNDLDNNLWRTIAGEYLHKDDYALNPIPIGAKKIRVTDNSSLLQVSVCVHDATYKALFNPSWSGSGVYSQEINVEDYPSAVYFALNYNGNPTNIEGLKIEFTF